MPERDGVEERRTSMRRQLGILFAALAIPLLVIQGWWSYQDYRGAREQAWADALAFADAVDLGVRQFMTQSEELLRSSAEQSGVSWLERGACESDMERLQGLLHFGNVLVVDTDGRIVCSANPVTADADALDWPWFPRLESGDSVIIGSLGEADFGGGWILPLVAPIRSDDGSVAGGLVGTLPMSEVSRLLGGFRLAEQQLATLATGDRMVIARSIDENQWVGRYLPDPTGSDRLVAPGRWVAEGPDLTGVQRTWGQVATESGWIVYVGIPDDLVFGPARREALAHMGGTLLIVLLGMFLATGSYRRIARALKELAAGVRVTESGEPPPVPPDTPEEIADVVEQFRAMLAARSSAEAAERAARKRFQSIFDNAVFGIYVSTADGRFLQVNPALVSMLGYASEQALLATGPEALYADPDQRRELIAASMEHGSIEMQPHELDWIRADGSPITVRVAGKMIDGPHGSTVFEMIVQDITDERRTEDQLRQTQKMEAIGQLAGGVAHDFNNLLTVIGGNVELLEDDIDESDPLRADLEQISRATKRARSLTRRLLAFSRTTGRGRRAVDLHEVIPEMAKMLIPVLGERVRLRTRLEDGCHRVSMDPGELEQLLLNLVLNARDAITGDGTIEVDVRSATRERGGMLEDGVLLSVSDDGVGMDAATRERIFDPFFTTKEMGEGTGLGLSTVYGIVQRARGKISVESDPGQGTRLDVWLPSLQEEADSAEADTPDGEAAGSERILVVEDDALVRSFVVRALEEAGFEVAPASSGSEALERIGEREARVDLILTDVVMPGLSGPRLAAELDARAPGIPILFMSGYVDNPFLMEELEDRPESLLRKPFTAVELRSRIRWMLDRRSGAEPVTMA